jgi:hypothetical protein
MAIRTRRFTLPLRMEILEQKIADVTTSPGARASATAELEVVRGRATSTNIGLFADIDDEPGVPDAESEGEQD